MATGNFIAINRNTAAILTSGQSIYASEDSAKRGIAQWVRGPNRPEYVIIELTAADIMRLLAEKGIAI